MPTPPIAYKTVTGRYDGPDGTDLAGLSLRFQPSATVVDASGNVVVPALPITVVTDSSGSFSVNLMVTDAAGTSPTGWTWRLSELFTGGREIDFLVPSSSPASVSFASLSPATGEDVRYAYATTAGLAALDARVATIETEAVSSYHGVHPFLFY